ncbi:tol-pal system-associated acyl-CoA thioesterase [Sphingomonas glacialis]|uniref:Tol-pal system-associated acyl-CoA thioesterase n=1 Tax=Sphingomonas glacialis TaxID=658225 RepID=A0A502FU59_9SPHN|nr:tol-pal system-associated acyl-CoA thioesterase [Sphingomonas glacialis]TPG53015.1 tol-pal system-associated acyl-CoA thioesterase [Sphingomonas glacialis]
MTTASDLDQPAQGRIVGTVHRFPLRVYFEDTDLSGIVYHANYLRYMERARSDMLRVVGIDQRAHQEGGGGAYAVTALNIRYRAPAKLDDALIVLTTLNKIRAASVDIQQRVMRGDTILTEADVTAALVAATGRPLRQPKEWIAAFSLVMGERAMESGDSAT